MQHWLSGRASRCQREGHEFKSRMLLHGPLAQQADANGLNPSQCRFESDRGYQTQENHQMDRYWEVEFPDTRIQVSGEWTERQAKEAIKTAVMSLIDSNLRLVEPEPEPAEDITNIEVVFGSQE